MFYYFTLNGKTVFREVNVFVKLLGRDLQNRKIIRCTCVDCSTVNLNKIPRRIQHILFRIDSIIKPWKMEATNETQFLTTRPFVQNASHNLHFPYKSMMM